MKLAWCALSMHVFAYSCNPAQCKLPSCKCPSAKVDGVEKPPQFITLTFDDSVNSGVMPIIDRAINEAKIFNPNGCPLSSTYFISTQYTDFVMVQQLYNMGHEIALHTMNHVSQPRLDEISGSYRAVNAFAGVPKFELTGFRFPFLNFTTETVRTVVNSKLFSYESSMTLYGEAETWPYTLDNGPYTTCSPNPCSADHVFPGFWQIPMYALINKV